MKMYVHDRSIWVVLTVTSVIALLLIITWNKHIPEQGDVDSFLKNHEADFAVAEYRHDAGDSGESGAFDYVVGPNRFRYRSSFRLPMLFQPGDQFKLMYDKRHPEEALLLLDQPLIPEPTLIREGRIIACEPDRERNWIAVVLEYEMDDLRLKRLQYFPISRLDTLREIKEKQLPVKLRIVPYNARRAYLNLDSAHH